MMISEFKNIIKIFSNFFLSFFKIFDPKFSLFLKKSEVKWNPNLDPTAEFWSSNITWITLPIELTERRCEALFSTKFALYQRFYWTGGKPSTQPPQKQTNQQTNKINRPTIPIKIPVNWIQLELNLSQRVAIMKANKGVVPFRTDIVPALTSSAAFENK